MKKTKMPAPKRVGTTKGGVGRGDRAGREAAALENLRVLEARDPIRFAEAMRILARLVAEAERERR